MARVRVVGPGGGGSLFITYLRRELWKRRRQTLIVAAGLGLAVATVMVVGSVSTGVRDAQQQVLESLYGVGTDITVTQAVEPGSGPGGGFAFQPGEGATGEGGSQVLQQDRLVLEPGSAAMDATGLDAVRDVDGVSAAAATLELTSVSFSGEIPAPGQGQPGAAPGEGPSFDITSFSVAGVDPDAAAVGPLAVVALSAGRTFDSDEVDASVAVLDETFAAAQGLGVGDTITVGGQDFEIIGTVASNSQAASTSADVYVPLATAQTLSGLTDQISSIYVQASTAGDVGTVKASIATVLPEATVSTQSDLASNVSGSLSTAANLIGSLGRWLSLVVLGVAFLLAVLFTLSGVSRRTREFGTLKAIGWRDRRIVGQVAGESLTQALLGGAFAVVLGVGAHHGHQPGRDHLVGGDRRVRRRPVRAERRRRVRGSVRAAGIGRRRGPVGPGERRRAPGRHRDRRPRGHARRCPGRVACGTPSTGRGLPQRRLTAEPAEPHERATPMYELVDVSKTYMQGPRSVVALTGVSMTIDDGDMVAVQGPTGGGKSTLLQMLGALDRPTSGSVLLNGRDLTRLSARELAAIRARELGLVFQTFNLISTLTAAENVETALVPLSLSKADRRERVRKALEAVELADRGQHLPAELSGGQQQRVAIARALVKEPTVLLADEPTGNLDEAMRDEVMGILEGLWRERGLTLVVVTHDSIVARRAPRRIRIVQGVVSEVSAATPA